MSVRLTLTRLRSPSPAATHIFLSTNVDAGIQSVIELSVEEMVVTRSHGHGRAKRIWRCLWSLNASKVTDGIARLKSSPVPFQIFF